MKNKPTLILILGLALSPALLPAQDADQPPQPPRPSAPDRGRDRDFEPGPREGGPGGQRILPPSPVINALDLNHDGEIDADELARASESLQKLDKNRDGKLTPDELRPLRRGPGGPPRDDQQGGPQTPRRPRPPISDQ